MLTGRRKGQASSCTSRSSKMALQGASSLASFLASFSLRAALVLCAAGGVVGIAACTCGGGGDCGAESHALVAAGAACVGIGGAATTAALAAGAWLTAASA